MRASTVAKIASIVGLGIALGSAAAPAQEFGSPELIAAAKAEGKLVYYTANFAEVEQQVIKASEAKKQQQINEAEGQAAAILAVASATAEGLRKVGGALTERGGIEAMQLRIGEEYVRQFGKLAKESTTLIVPGNLSDLASVVTMATSIVRKPSPAQP